MSNLKHPVGLNRLTGSVFGKRKFYTAKAVVLNTSYGEIIIASSDDIAMQYASDCIMASYFKLDINAAQNIAIFDAKHVTNANTHDKLTEQNKLLREALESLIGWGVSIPISERVNMDCTGKIVQYNNLCQAALKVLK